MPQQRAAGAGQAAAHAVARRWSQLSPPACTLLLALGLLAGCAKPDGVLVPIAQPPAGPVIDMLVATTRAVSPTPGVVFSGERGRDVAFTDIAVALPPARPVGSIQWPRSTPPDPGRDFAITRLEPLERADIPQWLRAHHAGKRRVLVYVHGFNTRFDASVFGFAQFVADTDAALVPVLFSWPSRGQVTDYLYDRDSATASRSALASLLTQAAGSRAVDEVVVLAHSMGAWLAVEAVRETALRTGRVPAKITNLVLASPDLDIDLFEKQVREMGPDRPRITIFVSREDRALGLSRLISGQMTRVGAVDLNDPAYADRLKGARDITVFDVSALQGGDALGHSAFATQPDAVRLIGARLAAGQKMDEDEVSPAQAAGQAAGAIATLPIRVFTGGAP